MLKTVLLIPPLTATQRMNKLAEGGAVMPGLGILYIAAFMRKKGLPVRVLDAEAQRLNLETTVQAVIEQKPAVLGITTTTLSITSAAAVAGEVKIRIPDIKIFLGGPHVTAMPRETMEAFPHIDGCILGDGELSFTQVVCNIMNGVNIDSNINGLAWRQHGKILVNPKKGHLEDLDSLPFPAWDLLRDFPKIYKPPFHSYRRLPVANIITARGCPYRCSFCDRSVFGQRIHAHSIDYVIEMIEYLVKDFGIKEISIKDDTFVLSAERVMEFCRQIHKRRLGLTWSCNATVNLVKDNMLREMKNAGCWMISYGIESGSPEMLRKMNKGITKEEVVNALKLTRKNNIVSKGFFMIGVPGETVKTMEETLDFVNKLPLDELNINFFTPFPGSRLFDELVQDGFQPDFTRMNMLDAVYIPNGLTADDLKKYQKRIIYSFYLRFSKLMLYSLSLLKGYNERKRISRMGKVFAAISFEELRKRLNYH